jgi:5-methylcytosine-specific restriction protein A
MPTLKKADKPKNRSLALKNRQEVYKSSLWERLRKSKLMSNPLCEFCLALGLVKPATDVHHKDSFLNYEGSLRQQKAFDYLNLISLCKEHHSFLHRKGTTRGLNLEFELEEWNKYNQSR